MWEEFDDVYERRIEEWSIDEVKMMLGIEELMKKRLMKLVEELDEDIELYRSVIEEGLGL